VTGTFTTAEIAALPVKHLARTNPELVVERHRIEVVDMPPFGRVINRERVVFLGETPNVGE
jgi:hypothetical protein